MKIEILENRTLCAGAIETPDSIETSPTHRFCFGAPGMVQCSNITSEGAEVGRNLLEFSSALVAGVVDGAALYSSALNTYRDGEAERHSLVTTGLIIAVAEAMEYLVHLGVASSEVDPSDDKIDGVIEREGNISVAQQAFLNMVSFSSLIPLGMGIVGGLALAHFCTVGCTSQAQLGEVTKV